MQGKKLREAEKLNVIESGGMKGQVGIEEDYIAGNGVSPEMSVYGGLQSSGCVAGSREGEEFA